MSVPKELLERFQILFTGYDKAFGRYVIKKAVAGEKASGNAWTLNGQPTEEDWRHHLEGTGPGLGIIMLQENDTCRFGAIDVDDKTIDHIKLEAKIKKLNFPLVVCRSKSGGAHLYCFTSKDVEATLLQRKLSEWCARLGFANTTEIFPKQTSRYDETDKGNWINIPYYNYTRSMRYAIIDGNPVSFDKFLDYAESMKVTAEDIEQTTFKPGNEEDDFYEAPPCLQHFEQLGGFSVGSMKNGMFNVGVYLRRRFPEDWEEKFNEYAAKMCDPPLKPEEIVGLKKQLNKKDYSFTCKQIPIRDHCQRRLCLSRKFGVGNGSGGSSDSQTPDIRIHVQYVSGETSLWSVEVAGKQIVVDTKTLYSPDSFNQRCMDALRIIPVHMPTGRWRKHIAELMQSCEVVHEAEEASERGQVWECIVSFLTQDSQAKTKDEITSDRPYTEGGKVYFLLKDVTAWLKRYGVPALTPNLLGRMLRDHGGEPDKQRVGGVVRNIWVIPTPDQAEPLDEEFSSDQVSMPKSNTIPEDGF